MDEVGATLNTVLAVMGDRLGLYRALAGGPGVRLDPIEGGQRVLSGSTHQLVAEAEPAGFFSAHQAGFRGASGLFEHGRHAGAGHRRLDDRRGGTQGRGRLDHLARFWLQALERLIDGGAQASRDRLGRARGAQRGDAPQEQRIPAGDPQEHEEQSRVKVTQAVGGQELRRLSQVEVAQAERRSLLLDLVEQGGAAIAVPVVVSPRDDQGEPHPGQGPGHEPQQQQGAGVGGVDVIDDHARRRSAARQGELIGHGHEPAEAAGPGGHHASVAFEQLHGIRAAQPGQDLLPRPQRRRPAAGPATGIDDSETAVLGPAHRRLADQEPSASARPSPAPASVTSACWSRRSGMLPGGAFPR